MAGGAAGPTEIPYHPPPSIGHEIGVMFGFIGAMLLSMLLYVVWFQIKNKQRLKQEDERMRMLRSQGLIPEEKPVVDGYADEPTVENGTRTA